MEKCLTLQRLGFLGATEVGEGPFRPPLRHFSVFCPIEPIFELNVVQPFFFHITHENFKIMQYFADVSKNQKKCEIKKCHHYQPIFTKIAIKTERKELRSWFCPYFFAFILLFPVMYNTYFIELFLDISNFDDIIARSCDHSNFF